MAFSMNNGGGYQRRRGFRGGNGAMAEINIVPLVDVVLVLLIIFMLTAHVMEYGMEVEVPKTKTTPTQAPDVLPVVNITKSGDLYLVKQEVNINELGDKIRARFKNPKAAYVRADKDCPWNVVAQVVSALKQQKIDIRLVTQPETVHTPAP